MTGLLYLLVSWPSESWSSAAMEMRVDIFFLQGCQILEKKFMEFAFFFKYIIQLKLNFFQKCIFA